MNITKNNLSKIISFTTLIVTSNLYPVFASDRSEEAYILNENNTISKHVLDNGKKIDFSETFKEKITSIMTDEKGKYIYAVKKNNDNMSINKDSIIVIDSEKLKVIKEIDLTKLGCISRKEVYFTIGRLSTSTKEIVIPILGPKYYQSSKTHIVIFNPQSEKYNNLFFDLSRPLNNLNHILIGKSGNYLYTTINGYTNSNRQNIRSAEIKRINLKNILKKIKKGTKKQNTIKSQIETWRIDSYGSVSNIEISSDEKFGYFTYDSYPEKSVISKFSFEKGETIDSFEIKIKAPSLISYTARQLNSSEFYLGKNGMSGYLLKNKINKEKKLVILDLNKKEAIHTYPTDATDISSFRSSKSPLLRTFF